MRPQQGLTVIELAIVMAVLAIVLGIAVRSLGAVLESARSADARGELLASMMLAANRSAVSGTRVALCPSGGSTACSDEPDWSRGWLVFMDNNANRDLDGGERVLRRLPALAGQVRLRSTVGRTRIVFQANGGNAGSNVTFTLCDGRGPRKALALVVSNTGRLRDGVPSPEAVAETCPR